MFKGLVSLFPHKANLAYKKKCFGCSKHNKTHVTAKKSGTLKENSALGTASETTVPEKPADTLPEMTWEEAVQVIANHKRDMFQFEAVDKLKVLLSKICNAGDTAKDATPIQVEAALMAYQVARKICEASGYRFIPHLSSL
ncbi:hypothetical protein CPB85DRAFT_1258189 [Mucidula mucida]|nr:hypothetical protein CPB85DRAFT_1260596 [Mucidula mucida]KAF8888420.1 hypothetical protein CPB85DRAFT_1258189 [Mucidula mucida]